MPHKCVKCNKSYKDDSPELLTGCQCGGKFFLFTKNSNLPKVESQVKNLTSKEKEKIERDVMDIVGNQIEKDKPVILDLESVNVLQPGKFELDITHLLNREPLIYKTEDGKYIIDLATSFQIKKHK